MPLTAAPPATISRENFHHVTAALGCCLPRRRVARMAAHHGLTPDTADRVPQSRNVALVEALARHQGDALLMLRGFGRLARNGQLFADMPALVGHDLYAVIRQIQRYLCLQSQLGDLEFVLGPAVSELRLHRRAEFEHSPACAHTLLFSISRLLMRGGLNHAAWRMTLRADPEPRERAAYRALYGVPVRFGAGADAIVIPTAHLARHAAPSAASLHYLAYCERQLRLLKPGTRWSDSVRHLLPIALHSSGTPQVACARLLALSPRSLQRRIEAEGESFRALLNKARRTLAHDLLHSPTLAAEDVSRRLGYRQPGQFYRAFRRWFDMSPCDYRAGITQSVPNPGPGRPAP